MQAYSKDIDRTIVVLPIDRSIHWAIDRYCDAICWLESLSIGTEVDAPLVDLAERFRPSLNCVDLQLK
jgi:hypothetical protein